MKKCKTLSIPFPCMFMIAPCTFIYIGLQDFAFFYVYQSPIALISY